MRAAVLDACVLYPATLRDFLLRLTVAEVVAGYWTAEILDECFRSILRDRPDLDAAHLRRTRQVMETAFEDRSIIGYEHLIHGLELPDSNDRHVLAAAIAAEVSVIVTFNLRDFPRASLEPHGVLAVHPDDFVCAAIQRAPEQVLEVLHGQVAALRRPPMRLEEVMDRLAGLGLVEAMVALRGRVGRC